jgi:hypothetical protein
MAKFVDTTTEIRCPVCDFGCEVQISTDGRYVNGEVRLSVDMSDARDHIAACLDKEEQ